MNPNITPMLYIDIQSLPPGHECEICGEVCYGVRCLRCERRKP